MCNMMWLLTDTVLQRRVVGIDDGWTTVRDPIGFIDRFAQLLERVIRSEDSQVESVAQVIGRIQFQLLPRNRPFTFIRLHLEIVYNFVYLVVEFRQLVVVEQLVRIGNMRRHGRRLVLGANSSAATRSFSNCYLIISFYSYIYASRIVIRVSSSHL